MSEDANKTLVQAFVSCRLDYCNSLFFGISVEPVAVGTERRRPSGYWYSTFRHITPVLRQLHWLPVHQCVDFKVATLVHRSLAVWYFTILPS